MEQKKKVLIAFVEDGKKGGVDKYIMNYYETLKEDVHFDFVTNRKVPELERKLAENGSALYETARLVHPSLQRRQLSEILREGKYDAFYLNTSTALSYIAMKAAYESGVPVRICHSHSSGIDAGSFVSRNAKRLLHRICRCRMGKYANRYLACSTEAAEWMFPKKVLREKRYLPVPNAFDAENYIYSETTRQRVRGELGLGTALTVGFVGTLCYPKNILFALEVFAKLRELRPDARFMVVGDGPMEEEARQRAEALSLSDSVLFLGRRGDVKDLLQAMDILLAPSVFEGLSFAALEAQAAGLPCFFSENVTRESAVTPFCRFLPLSSPPAVWAREMEQTDTGDRQDTFQYLQQSGYVLSQAKPAYLALLRGEKKSDDTI